MNIFQLKSINMACLMTLLYICSLNIANAESVKVNSTAESQLAQQKASENIGSPWLSSRLLVPHLTVVDVVESKNFYEQAFGFKVRFEDKPGKDSQHVEMSYKDELVLMFVPQNVRDSGTAAPVDFIDPKQLTSYLYLYVDSVDKAYNDAINVGGISIVAPYDSAWGDRFALVADPSGYHWGLAESKKLKIEK